MSNGPFSPDANDANNRAKAMQALAQRIARNDSGPVRRYNGPPPLNAGKPRFYTGPMMIPANRVQNH